MPDWMRRFRHRRLSRQTALWIEERERARETATQVPEEVRAPVVAIIERFIDHAGHSDAELARDLDILDRLLSPYPDLHSRFFRLRVVDDVVESLK